MKTTEVLQSLKLALRTRGQHMSAVNEAIQEIVRLERERVEILEVMGLVNRPEGLAGYETPCHADVVAVTRRTVADSMAAIDAVTFMEERDTARAAEAEAMAAVLGLEGTVTLLQVGLATSRAELETATAWSTVQANGTALAEKNDRISREGWREATARTERAEVESDDAQKRIAEALARRDRAQHHCSTSDGMANILLGEKGGV